MRVPKLGKKNSKEERIKFLREARFKGGVQKKTKHDENSVQSGVLSWQLLTLVKANKISLGSCEN